MAVALGQGLLPVLPRCYAELVFEYHVELSQVGVPDHVCNFGGVHIGVV